MSRWMDAGKQNMRPRRIIDGGIVMSYIGAYYYYVAVVAPGPKNNTANTTLIPGDNSATAIIYLSSFISLSRYCYHSSFTIIFSPNSYSRTLPPLFFENDPIKTVTVQLRITPVDQSIFIAHFIPPPVFGIN